MTQSVNVPGVGTLQFPDGMSQADMSAAIQKNYPQLTTPTTQHPDDSSFLKGIKDFGNEAGRVGVKAVTALPLMAMDMGVGVRNLGSKLTGGSANEYRYPSQDVDQALDSVLPPPTTKAAKASEMLSTLVASLGMPGPAAVQEVKQGLTGADAVKAATLRQGQAEGLVVPPNQTTGAPMLSRLANGWGGTNETNALAKARNQPIINSLSATDVGLPPTASLTTKSLQTNPNSVINGAVQSGYAPLKDIGNIPADAAHDAFLDKLASSDRGAANIDPRLGNPQIADLADALRKPSFDSGDMMDAISALRTKAVDASAQGNKTLASAYKQAAGGLESLIDRHLSDSKDPAASDLLTNFRLSRQTIAKSHDILDNLNTATGNVDAKGVGTLLDSGKLSGNLDTVGKFGRAFGDVASASKGEPNPVTAFQANIGEAATPVGLLTNLLGRPQARNYALSQSVQQSLMQPKGKTLSKAALDAVHANPAAFAAMYEDQNQ